MTIDIMRAMRAYIDESGDPGTQGKGSVWLVFGCVMVSEEETPIAKKAAQSALQKVQQGQGTSLHFSKLSHEQKHAAIDLFKQAPWCGVMLARNTREVKPKSRRIMPKYMYQYMAGYVIERISRRAATLKEQALVYFEEGRHLNSTNVNEFRAFIEERAKKGAFSIDTQWVSPENINIVPKDSAQALGHETLFIADGLAHAGFKACELGRLLKRPEPSYYLGLKEKLWGCNPLDGVDFYECGLLMRPKRLSSKYMGEFPWLALP